MDGQMELTDFLASKIKSKQVMDLTEFINSKGEAQYKQIGRVIQNKYDVVKDEDDRLSRITNDVSVYVLNKSLEYMDYLRIESNE